MAKIIAGGDSSTRLNQHIEKVSEILLELVPDLDFDVFGDAVPAVYLTNLLEVVQATTTYLQEDMVAATHELIALRVENELLARKLEAIENVPFDDALDHATHDLMYCLESSGMAETTPDGDLAWDTRITVSKGDLKPVLREAITTWADRKLRQ